jgi:DNA-directed RNA polymerase specialized sigma24 family protein
MNEATLDVGAAYEELRPHLLGALAKLARQGFIVSPWDGLDLIHDFFIEAWDGINSRYDPSRGTLDAYIYAAFIRFARPRIVRLHRFQSSLVEPENLDLRHSREEDDDESYVPPEDSKQIVREAVSHLPLREREILSRYLYAKPRAERMLARKFSLSRYGLRQALVDAFGRVMIRLDKPERMPERDWKVAVALWRDHRTVDEAAAYLGLTPHQVREANSRNALLLTEAMRRYHPSGEAQLRRNTMKPQRNLIPPYDLLERVLKSPGNEELLGQVRERADEVLAALENSEFLGLSEGEMQSVDPLWVAEVYEAMAAPTPREEENFEAADALFRANQYEEASIGAAFRETLLADLPEYLCHIEKWLSPLAPQVDEKEWRELMAEPSVQAGLPCTERLVPYGVTPLTVFYATEAVSSLLDRLMRYEMINADASVGLEMNRVEVDGRDSELLSVDALVDEIQDVSECSGVVAQALYSWSVLAAQYKPFLFSGFRASPQGEGVSLARTEEVYDDLYQRWGLRNAMLVGVS